MAKPTIILLHGMGDFRPPDSDDNTGDSFFDEFIASADQALARYPGRGSQSVKNMADIHEIHYDHIFDEVRKKMADEGKKIAEFLPTVSNASAVTSLPGIITKIAGFEASLNNDTFFYTHCLDVLFYKTYLGEMIRTLVAKEISHIISQNMTGQNIHIIAHSLGTAVLHDTLHKLYRKDYQDNDEIIDLSITTHKIKSVWMVANVSRLANSVLEIADPYDSVVRPGNKGMTEFMFNAHHALDPFTWPRRFKPGNDGSWIPQTSFRRYYHDLKTTIITNKDTHSFSQYIQDPEVNFPLFRLVFGLTDLSLSDKEKAIDEYDNGSLQGAYTELEGTLSSFSPTDTSNLSEIIDAAQKLRDFIEA